MLLFKNRIKHDTNHTIYLIENIDYYSHFLERFVEIVIFKPNKKITDDNAYLLLMNDGQDAFNLGILNTLDSLANQISRKSLLVVAIKTNHDRMRDYGVAYSADYLGRGNRAGLYNKFIMCELIPYLKNYFKIHNFKEKAFIGWSLGALSALDIVWNNANQFNKVGLLSPSLWWRRKAYQNGYVNEHDRLMHLQIKYGQAKPWLQIFIECGCHDETSDRNNNGIIDSIDDALDLIQSLLKIGFSNNQIKYLELKTGKHDLPTWKQVFPLFIKWGWID